jgi:polyisoprenyl-teichoic acid--peptidoglycan teichoic acid transferase
MDDLGLTVLDHEEGDDNSSQPEALPDGERKRRRTWMRILVITTSLLLAVVLGVGGFYLAVGLNALQNIKRDPGMMPTDDGRTTTVIDTGPVDFVLMGSDSRGSDRGRSDTLMVAHLNAERNTLYLISVPRDLYVSIPGHGSNKINAAYSFGGSALTIKTVEQLLGIQIDHAAMVNFEGFVGLTSEVGGVTIFNEIASKNLGFDFPRGEITLKGDQALAYVRQRYDLPRGDLDREARQRAVVKALVLKLLNPSTLANPATFNSVAGKVGSYLTVDSSLTNDAIWKLASSLAVRSAGDIRQLQVPISGGKRIPGAGAVLIPNTAQLATLSTAIQSDQLGAYWKTYGED